MTPLGENYFSPFQKDRGLWGLVVVGHSELFFFRVLEKPADDLDGRPRGAAEIRFTSVSLLSPYRS